MSSLPNVKPLLNPEVGNQPEALERQFPAEVPVPCSMHLSKCRLKNAIEALDCVRVTDFTERTPSQFPRKFRRRFPL